jgi:hypothetical protein
MFLWGSGPVMPSGRTSTLLHSQAQQASKPVPRPCFALARSGKCSRVAGGAAAEMQDAWHVYENMQDAAP